MKEHVCYWNFIKRRQRLVMFSSNILCDHPQRVFVLARISTRVPYTSQQYCLVLFQLGTQEESSVKNTPSLDIPLTATLGRVNQNSFSVMLICFYCELLRTARRIMRREWKVYCCIDKKYIRNFRKLLLLFVTYMGS